MVDRISKERRSWIMSCIRSENTKPEMIVRSLLHRMGYRFRLHRKDLPGKPDIVLPKHKTIIFVHGCFWHRHQGCKDCTIPSTNKKYWHKKFLRNISNDKKNIKTLTKKGWRVLIIWECKTENLIRLKKRIKSYIQMTAKS